MKLPTRVWFSPNYILRFQTSSLAKNRLSKKIFFGVKESFSWIFIFKMDVKLNFRIITKNHAADLKIGFAQKIDFRAVGAHESHPTAWELSFSSWVSWGLIMTCFLNLSQSYFCKTATEGSATEFLTRFECQNFTVLWDNDLKKALK